MTVTGLRAETAQEIADGIVYARGGIARIQNIQTERMTGTVFVGDRQGSFVREVMRPDKVRMEITLDGKTTVTTYNGGAGWKLDGISGDGQARELSAADGKNMAEEADIDGPFADIAKQGTQIELLDKEMLGPSLVWKLKVTLKGRETGTYYVESTGHYILLRENTRSDGGKTITFDSIYKNFQRVEGVLFPFTVISSSQDSRRTMTLRFESIQINSTIDQADFGKPSAPVK